MREDIDMNKIRKGDTVRVSLDDLPVTRVSALGVHVRMPDGSEQAWNDPAITAHEPAVRTPDWWGAKVVLHDAEYWVFSGHFGQTPWDGFYASSVSEIEVEQAALWTDVTVIVDKGGNQPAARCAERGDVGQCELYAGHDGDCAQVGAIAYADMKGGRDFWADRAEKAHAARRDAEKERDQAREQSDRHYAAFIGEAAAHARFRAAVERVRDKYHRANKHGGIIGSPVLDLTKALGDDQ